jgi:arabinofuranosyltransferase
LTQGVVLALPPLALAWLGWEQRWITDDAFIDLRIVQHVLAGYGPVYNLGERVEVYTNPLWVLLLAGLATLAAPFWALTGPAAGAAPQVAQVAPWGPAPLEWIAVLAGLALAAGGLLGAEAGALRLARRAGLPGFALPLGAAVFVAVPPSWDFATSGLETGLSLGWLGFTFWALAAGGGSRPYACAALAGCGPLIRPDLAVLSAAFLLVLLLDAGWHPRRVAGIVLAGGAAPLAYQVFRMGYFGALVPNTALTKEAEMAYWAQGWRYLRDFARPYLLWVPLGALALWGLGLLRHAWPRRTREPRESQGGPSLLPLLALPPLGALLHGLYVVRVGGDFMHGRMLLPTLFALLLPVMVVAGTRWWQPLLPAVVVLPWAVSAGLWLRPSYYLNPGPDPPRSVGREGIADERGYYVRLARHPHPVTLADYGGASWMQDGLALRRRVAGERGLLTWEGAVRAGSIEASPTLPLLPGVAADLVAVRNNIGLSGYAAGSRVHVVDRLGLGDPLGSRLRLERRGRPGHEKALPDSWAVARFGAPAGTGTEEAAVEAARAALACDQLRALLAAVEAPLTPGRFAANVRAAGRLTALRIPADPQAARQQACP